MASSLFLMALTPAGREVEALVTGRRALWLESGGPRNRDLAARPKSRGGNFLLDALPVRTLLYD